MRSRAPIFARTALDTQDLTYLIPKTDRSSCSRKPPVCKPSSTYACPNLRAPVIAHLVLNNEKQTDLLRFSGGAANSGNGTFEVSALPPVRDPAKCGHLGEGVEECAEVLQTFWPSGACAHVCICAWQLRTVGFNHLGLASNSVRRLWPVAGPQCQGSLLPLLWLLLVFPCCP